MKAEIAQKPCCKGITADVGRPLEATSAGKPLVLQEPWLQRGGRPVVRAERVRQVGRQWVQTQTEVLCVVCIEHLPGRA